MSKEELLKWLDTCPSHKYDIAYEDENGVSVNFSIEEEEDV
jgi:hypothetical protein